MASLTSALPELSELLGFSRDALYERQRALVRLGALPTPVGRGRGSGAEASAETVSMLILSVMMSDSLVGVNERIFRLMSAPPSAGKVPKCKFTGAPTFGEAMTAALQREDLSSRIYEVLVYREVAAAAIRVVNANRSGVDPAARVFLHRGESRSDKPISVTARIGGKRISRIGKLLEELS